jgi:DNA-binding transcriptional LysR family regulator
MDLEPRLLRYFMAVAKELHFSRAAARLYISQPALSNQIQHLERTLGTDLFVRTSRQVELTPAGRALLEEAPLALGALERAAERARLAGAGIAGTVRLGYAPMAGYETLGAILTAVEHNSPNVTVIATELFSTEIPARVLAGELDIGLALFPEPMRGVRSEPLRIEPLALLLGKHHRLADVDSIPLTSLENETLLLFPRELAPGYYDRVIAACEQSGFQPRVRAFTDPPPQAMVARLQATREVGLPPASFAFHAAAAEPRRRRSQDRPARDPGGVVDPVGRARPIRSDRALPRARATMLRGERLAVLVGRNDQCRSQRPESVVSLVIQHSCRSGLASAGSEAAGTAAPTLPAARQVAVDRERLAGQSCGVVAGEHCHHSRGVFGGERSGKRLVRLDVSELGRRDDVCGRGARKSRRYRGNRDPVAAEPDGQRAQHSDQRAL